MLESKSTKTGQRPTAGKPVDSPKMQDPELHRNVPSVSINPDPHRGQISKDETALRLTSALVRDAAEPLRVTERSDSLTTPSDRFS
jgi:hypothetical protein